MHPAQRPPPPGRRPRPRAQSSLCNLLLFGRLDKAAQAKIAEHTWERAVAAGEILIQEGEVGLAASELYVVKSGKFEVLERRKGVNMRVNVKERGDVFGEVSLLYNCPRTATVAATTDAVVWVLERDVFRWRRGGGRGKGAAAQAAVCQGVAGGMWLLT